ncbi:hypothetical protein GCM10009716_04030 [Streptomyces sodiiphilus]|uniref:WD40 repeat domain-containing protein n=1 Tax=Streptomyces sodiiphilus TaxID=226217 RepID=A0ABP5A2Y7_9ACTN
MPLTRPFPAVPRGPAARAALFLLPALLLLLPACTARADDTGGGTAPFTIEDERITESSGLQASERHPGVYWTHNDSGYAPRVYAVDSATGQTVATVTLEGVEGRDLESIHLGPDGDLYVGDIGDNFDGAWPHVWIYRFPEPERLADVALTPVVYTVRYEDGPRDAEALMVHPGTGRVYIASKKGDATGALYAGPEQLTAEGVNVFRRVADTELQVTGGAFSPDGTRLVLRGYFAAEMYRWDPDGPPEEIGTVTVPLQRQGESVTFTRDGRTLMFGSEGLRSQVRPVALDDELLPDSAREEPEGGDGTDRADGREERDGNGGDAEGGTDGTGADGEREVPLLLIGLVLAGALLFALRKRK